MYFATKSTRTRIWVWLVWALVLFACLSTPSSFSTEVSPAPAVGVVLQEQEKGERALFPWWSRYRWKKWAWRHYQAWRRRTRRAQQVAGLARLALRGMVPMAQVVDWLTARQVRYQLGALPVLYALLETLKVREIINRHCPTRAEVDHGTVVLVLILNRLMFPLPLYQIADLVAQTVLVAVLDLPPAKFNDDRLERTLDALAPHLETIWLEVVSVAFQKADIDLSVLFYDLTAFVVHGRYADSELIDHGFAHNTPSNKRKFKLALNTVADGNLPWVYRLWSGRTVDQATVQENMSRLARCLQASGRAPEDTLVVGDRAMLNAEIVLAYKKTGLRFLGGLRGRQALLKVWSDEQFEAYPIVPGPDPQYWGRGCEVTFTHEGRTVTHKGLVVLAGPLRDEWRQNRREQLRALQEELTQVRSDIGQPRLRSIKAVQRRVNSKLRASHVGKFIQVHVYETPCGAVNLHWQLDREALAQQERLDGRYLLVTNDWTLSHQQMFQLYRDKDGVETAFRISKQELRVAPLHLHKDQRIQAMLLLNMIALLAYRLLAHQLRQQGVSASLHHIIRTLEELTLIESHFLDGSLLRRLTPLSSEGQRLWRLASQAVAALQFPFVQQEHPLPMLPLYASSPPAVTSPPFS